MRKEQPRGNLRLFFCAQLTLAIKSAKVMNVVLYSCIKYRMQRKTWECAGIRRKGIGYVKIGGD